MSKGLNKVIKELNNNIDIASLRMSPKFHDDIYEALKNTPFKIKKEDLVNGKFTIENMLADLNSEEDRKQLTDLCLHLYMYVSRYDLTRRYTFLLLGAVSLFNTSINSDPEQKTCLYQLIETCAKHGRAFKSVLGILRDNKDDEFLSPKDIVTSLIKEVGIKIPTESFVEDVEEYYEGMFNIEFFSEEDVLEKLDEFERLPIEFIYLMKITSIDDNSFKIKPTYISFNAFGDQVAQVSKTEIPTTLHDIIIASMVPFREYKKVLRNLNPNTY